jgi:hypothetical protein
MEKQIETTLTETPGPESEQPSAKQLYELLQRLVDLATTANFKNLVAVPLDAMLTTNQAAEWLQITRAQVNAKVRAGIIPAIRLVEGSRHRPSFRFHPRTILAKVDPIYGNKKRRGA